MLCSEKQGSSFGFPGVGLCCLMDLPTHTKSLWGSFQPQAPLVLLHFLAIHGAVRVCSLVTALWPLPHCSPGV